MEIREHKIKVERTGFFYQIGDIKTCKAHWFVCHGYGQLANNLIRRFDKLSENGHAVTSVESLNRFYWQGVTGQVVTTWMTKRYRLDEISDNNAYLSDIYDSLDPNGKKILFGFSQGGTTMWRWIFEKQPEFDVFINYAGWMPEDIPLSKLKEYLADKTLIFTYGTNDEYLTEERIAAFMKVVDQSGLKIIIHKTDGEHKVDRQVLDDLYTMYIL